MAPPVEGAVLLVGCAPRAQLERIAADLRSREPERELWLLSLIDAPFPQADRVIPYRDEGGLRANLRGRLRLLRELQAADLHLVVLPKISTDALTRSNIAALGCLVGVPLQVCDADLEYAIARPGLATAARTFARAFVLARVPRELPVQALAYGVTFPFRALYAMARALWLVRSLSRFPDGLPQDALVLTRGGVPGVVRSHEGLSRLGQRVLRFGVLQDVKDVVRE